MNGTGEIQLRISDMTDGWYVLRVSSKRAIAERLAVSEPTIEAIGRRLDGRRVLLVLDNAEHLLDAVALLAQSLLDTAPGLRLVVTSQAPGRSGIPSVGQRVDASINAS